MEFKVLGPLEVTVGESPLSLGGRKQRLVLAHLILRANAVVPTDVLIDEVWGDEPPDSVRSTLQGYVSHLRRALGERLEGKTNGYVLHVDEGELDAASFEAKVKDAKRSLATDPAKASAGFADALAVWRGAAFADLADESSLQGEIARLDELRLAATEHRIAAELATGRHSTMVSELEALTSRYPLRERLWAHLMLALYQSGRQAEALDAYQRARQVLQEELGANPSAELQRLHQQILSQDPELQAETTQAPPPVVRHTRGDLELGTEFAGYRVLAVLGRGGMSVVYLAEHLGLERKVALKVLAPQLADDDRFRERFVRESRIAAGMEHQNIVPIFEAGEAEGLLFIAMRYVPGIDLGRLILREGMLDPERVVWVIRDVASALDAAHARGLVHRDVKPGNILVVEGEGSEGHDLVYLSDFGLTKRLEGGTGAALTQTGQFVGTVDYVAPEQIEGRPVDARTDVYSLACVLFECLSGKVPFERDTQVAALYAHLGEKPPRPTTSRPDLPVAVDGVVAKALSKPAADRYGTCGEFATAVRESLRPTVDASVTGDRTTWSRWRAAVGAVAVALITGVIVFSVSRGETPAAQDEENSSPPTATPSPTPEPNFATVDRSLTEDEQRLHTYIPEGVGGDCLPLDREGSFRGELAALVCDGSDVEVLYELFATGDAMGAAFQTNANINQAPEGDCATDDRAIGTYTIEGEVSGRVLCYTIRAVGSTDAAETDTSHIEWTDENASVYAHAIRNDLGDLSLYEWWLSSSGPAVTTDDGQVLPTKDRPGSLGPRLSFGSYLSDIPERFRAPNFEGIIRQTVILRLEDGSYEMALDGDVVEAGSISFRKPNAILFAPESTDCPGVADRLRPVTYTWSASGEQIIWEKEEGGRCAGPQPLTGIPWTRAPAGLIALALGGHIELMDPGGSIVLSTTQPLTGPNTWPDWSPDGSRIVFAGAGEEGFDLYAMDRDGTDAIQLTDPPGDEITPAWSPDGTRIAFVFDEDEEESGNFRSGISLINPDGTGSTELLVRENESVYGQEWSPDGAQIAFTIFAGPSPGVYVIDADGGGFARVREEPGVVLSWMPDGHRIVCACEADGRDAILTVRPDGSGEQVLLAELPEGVERPVLDWSPDARWLVMSGGGSVGSAGVFLVRADGAEAFKVATGGSEPAWRPEGD